MERACKQRKQTRARIVQDGPGTAHQTSFRQEGRIRRRVGAPLVRHQQHWHHQPVDTMQPSNVPDHHQQR